MTDQTTVVIPCYNAAETLEEAYASLPAQDAADQPPLEILMVDDCSQDDTATLIRSLEMRDPRVRGIFNPENAGVSACRNAGLEKATGTFILFMDADDKMMAPGLSLLHRHMTEDVDFVRAKHLLWNAQTGNVSENEGEERNFVELHAVQPGAVPQITAIYSSWNALFRRDLILRENLRFDSGMKLGEDRDFNIRYLLKCRKITLLNDYTYMWRKNAQSGQQATQVLVQDPVEVFGSIRRFVRQLDSAEFSALDRHRDYLSTAMVVELTNFIAAFSKLLDKNQLPEAARADIVATIAGLRADWVMDRLTDAKGHVKAFADLYVLVRGNLGGEVDDAFFRAFLKTLSKIRRLLNTQGPTSINEDLYRTRQEILQAVFALGRARRTEEALDQEIRLLKQSRIVDVGYYRSQNPDVAASGMNEVAHYVEFGASEMRNPNAWFDTSRYFANHPDLVLSGVNPLVHYLNLSAFPMNRVS